MVTTGSATNNGVGPLALRARFNGPVPQPAPIDWEQEVDLDQGIGDVFKEILDVLAHSETAADWTWSRTVRRARSLTVELVGQT